MIRSEHVKEEMKKAKKIFDDKGSTVEQKLDAIYKLITVSLKVALSVRTNTKLTMEKLEVKPITPRTKEEGKGGETTEE